MKNYINILSLCAIMVFGIQANATFSFSVKKLNDSESFVMTKLTRYHFNSIRDELVLETLAKVGSNRPTVQSIIIPSSVLKKAGISKMELIKLLKDNEKDSKGQTPDPESDTFNQRTMIINYNERTNPLDNVLEIDVLTDGKSTF